ncbi:MAG: PAS-domain containing protein [Pseudomonadota bacterium]
MSGSDDSLGWMAVAVLLSAVISVVLLWLVSRTGGLQTARGDSIKDTRSVFLIKDGKIVDQCQKTPQIVGVSTWPELRNWLGDRFRDVPYKLNDQADSPPLVFRAKEQGDEALLTIQSTPLGQSITLEDQSSGSAIGRHALLLDNQRADRLQTILQQAPAVVFAIDGAGKLLWGNGRFEALSVDARCAFIEAARDREEDVSAKLCIMAPDDAQKEHYELSFMANSEGTVIYANNVTRLVEADNVRSSFVQTLTKTFADLSTGLAVFDRDQRLVLFNPAVLDLTNLPADFLATRPHMMEFFDRLRDNHVMPEPKSYSTWRKQIKEMITSAVNGFYSESWSLPGGMTYKLTGRPHPNGAIAFLIEDITDEMTLTRQSRSQLETHQSILDAMQESIAVIGADGGLLVCNASFSEVMGFDPDARLSPTSFSDVMDACRSRFPNATIWNDLAKGAPFQPLETRLRDASGQAVQFRVEPLHEGLIMLNLSALSEPVPLSA